MSLKDIKPGTYTARVVDYGIVMVEKIKQPKAFIQFAIKLGEVDEMITWNGFLTKQDGEVNKKTLDSIMACGFKGKLVSELNSSGALDTKTTVSIEVIMDGEYPRVEWINSGARSVEKMDVKKLKGMNLSKVDAYLAKANKGVVKNFAEDIKQDDHDDIPF